MAIDHVEMKANMAAHCLALAALQQSLEQIWMKEYPFFIHDILIS
jgi:hypothetical protein